MRDDVAAYVRTDDLLSVLPEIVVGVILSLSLLWMIQLIGRMLWLLLPISPACFHDCNASVQDDGTAYPQMGAFPGRHLYLSAETATHFSYKLSASRWLLRSFRRSDLLRIYPIVSRSPAMAIT